MSRSSSAGSRILRGAPPPRAVGKQGPAPVLIRSVFVPDIADSVHYRRTEGTAEEVHVRDTITYLAGSPGTAIFYSRRPQVGRIPPVLLEGCNFIKHLTICSRSSLFYSRRMKQSSLIARRLGGTFAGIFRRCLACTRSKLRFGRHSGAY